MGCAVSWRLPNLRAGQTFVQTGLHAGIGANLDITRRLSLTADVRAFGRMRHDEIRPAAYYTGLDEDVLVPKFSGGLQMNFGVSLRF